jgi:hypothetical protein
MKTKDREKNCYTAWLTAAVALSIRVESPYLLKSADGSEVPCAAYLPDFGGSNGMVIGCIDRPDYKTDRGLQSAAKSRGFYCSFINSEVYEHYNEEVFKEALLDWGFFGDESLRPNWMKAT